MLNEFNYYLADDTEPRYFNDCAYPPYGIDSCNPYSQITAGAERGSSMGAIFGIYVGCYLISWAILVRMSKKYE